MQSLKSIMCLYPIVLILCLNYIFAFLYGECKNISMVFVFHLVSAILFLSYNEKNTCTFVMMLLIEY